MRGRRGTGLSRGLLVLALFSGAGSPVNAQIPAAAPAGAPEAVLIELQIGRLATRTVQAYRVRTEALIPLSQLLELTEIRFHLSADGRLEARVDPGDRRLIIDARRDTMQYGTHRVRLEPDFRLFREGELYVGTERLGDLLGARFVVTWPDLVVTLVDPSDLPVGRRTRREAEREAFLQRGERSAPDVRLRVARPSWDGLVLDYTVSSFSTAFDQSAYTASLGADALGGSLELAIHGAGAAVAVLDGSWTGVWRDRPWLRQVRLGDGSATGPRGWPLRGVLLTNAPYLRPSYVADVPYKGDLGPGWSVEAYRGGDLVAYDSTDVAGAFALNLPVRYGENPVDFLAYGPFGEIRAFNRTYRVLAELLPAHRLEYGVSAGSCRSPLCGATANADVRYGLARRWTVQAGVDGFWRDTLPDLVHPYISLVGNPTNAWALELEGVGRSYVRGGIRYEPTLNLRLAAEAAAFAADASQPLVDPRGRRSQWTLTAFWRPVPREGFAFLDGRLEQVRTMLGDELHARLAASFQVADVRWFPFVRMERTASTGAERPFAGFDVSSLPHPGLGPVLGPVWVRGGLEAGRSGVNRAAVYLARPLGAALRAEIGVTWSEGSLPPTYSLVVTTNLPVVRGQTTLTASPGAPALATQFVQGSLLWDRASGAIAAVPGPALERGGLTGYAFLDENGNGTRDPGEEAVPDLRVRVGSASARTDASGHYRVWDLIPFEPVLVTVDSLSLSSPLVVPAFATASVVPGPNRFRALDIPIARAGVIEGRVELAGRGRGGVTLLLTDRRTGTRRRLTTFSDGAFYALGIRPGDYELTVEERVLDALGAAAEPVRFTLVSGANGVGRDGIVVTLTPRP